MVAVVRQSKFTGTRCRKYETSSGDLISPLSFNISQDAPVVVGVDFRKHTVHLGGEYSNNATPDAMIYGIPSFSSAEESTVAVDEIAYCEANGHSFFYREMITQLRTNELSTTRCPNHYSVCQTEACMIECYEGCKFG